MRVGRVVSVEDFPEARKPAWKLTIDFGPELGLKRSSARITHYSREELEGTLVVARRELPAAPDRPRPLRGAGAGRARSRARRGAAAPRPQRRARLANRLDLRPRLAADDELGAWACRRSGWCRCRPSGLRSASTPGRLPGRCSTCGASVRTRTWWRLPSPETTVSEIARNAGTETVGGLTEPLREIVNVAGTRALADPPAGFLTLVPCDPPPADGCGETPPDPEPVGGLGLGGRGPACWSSVGSSSAALVPRRRRQSRPGRARRSWWRLEPVGAVEVSSWSCSRTAWSPRSRRSPPPRPAPHRS